MQKLLNNDPKTSKYSALLLYFNRGFNKHQRPTKSVGYFNQRRQLLSA